jgi:RNA polymerase sigma-70 factor (ECF subfamily)
VQEVFTVLVQKLPEFTYDRHQGFRRWLRTVTLNKWRDACRRRAARPALPNEHALAEATALDGPDGVEDAEYQQHLVSRALEIMQAEFHPVTWQTCWQFVVDGRPAADVARDLGISVNTVYLAKGRVLRRLRSELEGLLD